MTCTKDITSTINLKPIGDSLLVIETVGYISRQYILKTLIANNIPRLTLPNGDIHVAKKYEAVIRLYI